jgi:16S rRNA processing protein RimM
MVTVGLVIRPHGNRGEVVVLQETDYPDERFRPGASVAGRREEDDGPVRTLVVATSFEHQGRWVVGFEGVDSIDAAETLRGMELRIPAAALRALEPGRYYLHDLVGCTVRTTAGRLVGTIERVDLGHGVPMLVIASERGEVLVPFAEAFCRRIDVAAREVAIEAPEGLIELNQPGAGSTS